LGPLELPVVGSHCPGLAGTPYHEHRSRARFDHRSPVEPKLRAGAAAQLAAELGPAGLGVADAANRPRADLRTAVGLEQQSFEGQPIAVEFGEASDRRPARAGLRRDEPTAPQDHQAAPSAPDQMLSDTPRWNEFRALDYSAKASAISTDRPCR
jgi:hypothetical protein